jgi:hypothetical protein
MKPAMSSEVNRRAPDALHGWAITTLLLTLVAFEVFSIAH